MLKNLNLEREKQFTNGLTFFLWDFLKNSRNLPCAVT